MSPELTQRLVEKYPNLYRGVSESPTTNLMCFGFECGDGWFNLIDELSAKLEPMGIKAMQVKEKFGTLRFYVDFANDEAFDLIDRVCAHSALVCELCGKPGELHGDGWMMTRCSACHGKS